MRLLKDLMSVRKTKSIRQSSRCTNGCRRIGVLLSKLLARTGARHKAGSIESIYSGFTSYSQGSQRAFAGFVIETIGFPFFPQHRETQAVVVMTVAVVRLPQAAFKDEAG